MVAMRRPRKRYKMRIILITTIPKLSMFCGSVLFVLALLSFVAGPYIDLDRLLQRPHALSITLLHTDQTLRTNASLSSRLRLLDLEDVPSEGDPSISHLWSSKFAEVYYGCSNPSHHYTANVHNKRSKHHLMIAASGGLNQQRTGITDAVVVARMLNVTLVVPKLDQKSFWKDKSDFGDIFDIDWFINSLSNDVTIVKELPLKVKKEAGRIHSMRVPRKCTPHCYEARVLPALNKRHVMELTKFDYRLANRLPSDLQKLRCKVNYHALRFTKSITDMGQLLVDRMREKSSRFVALHLRFEPDMLAFSGCYFGGGDAETKKLGSIRKRWKSLHTSNPEKERRHGKCPLTPQEVGLMLRALGFGKDVYLYVASGEVYGGEESLAPLKAMFPNYYTKDTLASKEELEPFSSYSSRMAALDYIVCDQSDVFVTNNNGNMAKMLAGRRRYFGHKRTIRPNAKKLSSLFLSRQNMSWDAFALRVRAHQKGFMGEPNEVRPGRGEFHEFPLSCVCEKPGAKELIENSAHNRSMPKPKNADNSQNQHEALQIDSESGADAEWSGKDYVDESSQGLQSEVEEEADLEYVMSD